MLPLSHNYRPHVCLASETGLFPKWKENNIQLKNLQQRRIKCQSRDWKSLSERKEAFRVLNSFLSGSLYYFWHIATQKSGTILTYVIGWHVSKFLS